MTSENFTIGCVAAMVELYWTNLYTKEKELRGQYSTDQEARAAMVKELDDKGIKPYYYRMWGQEENETMVDFGSHSQFYIIKEVQ